MLDLADFVSDRGGNPNKIKESQRKRFAPENVVDEVIALYEEARRGIHISAPSNGRTNLF
jgi:seryl-tRNA synthetase